MKMIFEINKKDYLTMLVEDWETVTPLQGYNTKRGFVKLVSNGKEVHVKENLIFEELNELGIVTYILRQAGSGEIYDEKYNFNEVKQYMIMPEYKNRIKSFITNNSKVIIKEDYFETSVSEDSSFIDHIVVDYSNNMYKIRQIFNSNKDIFVLLEFDEGKYITVEKIKDISFETNTDTIDYNNIFKFDNLDDYLYKFVKIIKSPFIFKYGFCVGIKDNILDIVIISPDLTARNILIHPNDVIVYDLFVGDINILPINGADDIDKNIFIIEGNNDPIANELQKLNNYKINISRVIRYDSDTTEILYYTHSILLCLIRINSKTGQILEVNHYDAYLNEHDKVDTCVDILKMGVFIKIFVLKEYVDEESKDKEN